MSTLPPPVPSATTTNTTTATPQIIEQWVASVTSFSTEYAGWPASNVVGASNTYPKYGDIKTAWAPSSASGTQEFLELQFAQQVLITGIQIFETYHPGAVVKISAKKSDNTWDVLYSGQPQQKNLPATSRIFSPDLKKGVVSNAVRLDLDCTQSASWSEIDAVKLLGVDPSFAGKEFTLPEVKPPVPEVEVYGPTFHKHISELYLNGKYSDVELVHDTVTYKCHRILLCKAAYFADLFEANPDKKQFAIDYNDPLKVFPLLLKFIYEGRTEIVPSTMLAVKQAAYYFKLKELITIVENYLNQNITSDVVFSLLQTGLAQESKEDDVLVVKSIEFLAKNFGSLLDKISENMTWIPLGVLFKIIGHDRFVMTDEHTTKYSQMLKQVFDKFEVLKKTESVQSVLRALAKSNTLKSEMAYVFLKAISDINATATPEQKISDELPALCYPIIAAEFDRLEATSTTSVLSKAAILELEPKPFAEIMSSDDLLAGTEDQVYDTAIKYVDQHGDKLSDENKLVVLRTVRYPFVTLAKLQGLIKELNDPSGKAAIKLLQGDLMQALYARVNRTEASTDTTTTTTTNDMPIPKHMLPRTKRVFVHKSDFDTNGILYWIGCNYGTSKYENPVTRNLIKVTASTTFESGKAEYLVNHTPISCNMHAQANANFIVDLVKIQVMPTKYCLRHTDARDTECLRNWILQVSKDGTTWTTIKEHKDDQSIAAKSATASWDLVDPKKEYYRYFRLEQTGNNSANSTYLNLGGFEIYGFVRMGW